MKKLALAVIAAAAVLQGCTTPLIEGQKRELRTYEEKGLKVEEKSPGVAAALGLLPGVGYFYTGHYVLGITTIPLYPLLGPIWMPFDTHGAAEARNYYATKAEVERAKAKAIRENDHRMEDKEITYEEHIRLQRDIEAKYSAY